MPCSPVPSRLPLHSTPVSMYDKSWKRYSNSTGIPCREREIAEVVYEKLSDQFLPRSHMRTVLSPLKAEVFGLVSNV